MMTDPKRYQKSCLLIVILLAAGCGESHTIDEEIHTADLPAIELEYQFTITDSEDLFFRQILTLASDSQQRIYLGDAHFDALTIHQFDRRGEYVTSIGRPGSGPGEFQSLHRFFIDQNDRLIANDVRQARNTIFSEEDGNWEVTDVFSVEGQHYTIESIGGNDEVILRQTHGEAPPHGAYWFEHELATGHLYEGLRDSNVHHFEFMGTLFTEVIQMTGIPYGRSTVVASGPDGKLYLVWNEQFEMAIYDTQLELTDSLTVPLPNQPISGEEKREEEEIRDDIFRSLVREHMPDTKPVIRNMIVDPAENLWLQTCDSPEYLVLDSHGRPLGSFDLPEGADLAHVDDSRIYALRQGDEGYEVMIFEHGI